jgi:alpha-L-rhamnosidase
VGGSFRCSDPLINRLQQNIVWGQRGNFLDVPTDCPQRDERLGWTGDAQIFARTAACNYDVTTFFHKWLRDLRDGQHANGSFPDVAPDAIALAMRNKPRVWPNHSHDGNAAWADAGVICPWIIYQQSGDPRILADNYAAMVAWIEYQRRTSRDFLRPVTAYGDWLATDAVTPFRAPTPNDMIGTAYFARTTECVAQIARILGHTKDAVGFDRLNRRIIAAFQREYVTPTGRLAGDTQTGYLLALAFDLLPPRLRPRAVARLAELIERNGIRLATGFVGTPLLCPVLSRFGRDDLAYGLLFQREYPSWLYPVRNGATTMWERWNSWTKESGFGDVGMNSFNHYAYGAIGEWLYSRVAGIALNPESPGYKQFRLAPAFSSSLRYARAELASPHGLIRSAWRLTSGRLHWEVTVPANTSATLSLPATAPGSARVTSVSPSGARKFRPTLAKNDQLEIDLPSGVYRIEVRNPQLVRH